ncbi:NADH dehydrogenase [ubiquinone] 1 beta subcomplex subunit 4 [Macrobrachium rosenbergii]|uniref:NADH dehydrogenase [ubiquinone] 1 beta subcomplex subunit 4 n=1 Tax=Macrobrachium rosenbergii TaxID=79674 RepID=UPI0034D3E542
MADSAEVIRDRAARKAAIKKEFIKQITNPHRHASGEGGALFDPAVQRYMSMKVTLYDHFKPTVKTSLMGLGLIVLPIIGYGYMMKVQHDAFDHKCRTGQIPYAERKFKFI